MIPQWQRHARIFAMFEALLAGQRLMILSDHEPRPLHAQLELRYGRRFAWEQRQLGDGRWEVAIARSGASAGDCSPLAVLRRNAIFGRLGDEALGRIVSCARSVAIKRHHSVVEQGVQWPYAGVVESGIVQAVLSGPSGREQAIYDALPDEFFGETALLDGGVSALRHVALTANTRVVLVPTRAVDECLVREPRVLPALAALSAQRFRTVLERFAVRLGSSTTARVARVLLPFAGPGPGLCAALPPLPAMTQTEIAISAGTVKEVVSRAFNELEAAGAIERFGGRVVRLERAKLAEAVSDNWGA